MAAGSLLLLWGLEGVEAVGQPIRDLLRFSVTRTVFVLWLTLALSTRLAASDYDEFEVKREEVFEFAQKPRLARRGDRVEIKFETKGLCDVTVAIEEASVKAPGTFIEGRQSGDDGRPSPAPGTRSPVPGNEGSPSNLRHLRNLRMPSGKIVRHLASGVLGPNAPEPFRKNSKARSRNVSATPGP